jgi:hypothetical protein
MNESGFTGIVPLSADTDGSARRSEAGEGEGEGDDGGAASASARRGPRALLAAETSGGTWMHPWETSAETLRPSRSDAAGSARRAPAAAGSAPRPSPAAAAAPATPSAFSAVSTPSPAAFPRILGSAARTATPMTAERGSGAGASPPPANSPVVLAALLGRGSARGSPSPAARSPPSPPHPEGAPAAPYPPTSPAPLCAGDVLLDAAALTWAAWVDAFPLDAIRARVGNDPAALTALAHAIEDASEALARADGARSALARDGDAGDGDGDSDGEGEGEGASAAAARAVEGAVSAVLALLALGEPAGLAEPDVPEVIPGVATADVLRGGLRAAAAALRRA